MQKIDFVNAKHPAINDTNLNKMQDNIETAINAQVSGDTLPLGAMIPFPGGTIPDNYLLCDGSAVSRTTYALLFSVIGTTYGEGDGSTTFNLPDMRLRTAVGVDTRDSNLNVVGKTYGEKNHTLTKNELPANIIDTANTGSNTDGYIARAGYSASGSYNFGGQTQPFNVMQPSMATNYIIKAFQTAGIVSQVVNQHSTSTANVYSCNYVNPQAIYCKLGADFTINNSDYRDVTNWQLVDSVGSAFSISGGKVKIGSGVNKIKVTVKIRAYHNGLEGLYSFIRKNNSSPGETWVVDDINGYRTIYNQAILDVQENDVITINAYGNNIVLQANSTTMIVEKIA